MRPIELAGLLCAILPALALLNILPTKVGVAASILSGIVLVSAILWLGAYWQLIPLYIGVVLATTSMLFFVHQPLRIRAVLAAIVVGLLIATAVFTYILPMFRLPKPTGTYAVGTRIIELVDPQRMETHVAGPPRPRDIMVQVWYPANPNGQHLARYSRPSETSMLSSYRQVLRTHSYLNAPVARSTTPFPVILFNPGWTGQRFQNTFQMEDLASHGFIVVGIDHTYNSSPVAFPDGRIVRAARTRSIDDFHTATLDDQLAFGDREVRIQAGDNSLVLDYLSAANMNSGSPWFQHVDANDAGVFGHSFGGATAAQTCYQDPRVKAAINMDGWVFGDVSRHGLDKPFMIMNDDEAAPSSAELRSPNVQTRRNAEMNVHDIAAMGRSMGRFGGYMLTIRGSSHYNFCDRPLYSPVRRLTGAGVISPQRADRIIEDYTLQFFLHYLQDKPTPLLNMETSPYKEVQFENWFTKNALTH